MQLQDGPVCYAEIQRHQLELRHRRVPILRTAGGIHGDNEGVQAAALAFKTDDSKIEGQEQGFAAQEEETTSELGLLIRQDVTTYYAARQANRVFSSASARGDPAQCKSAEQYGRSE